MNDATRLIGAALGVAILGSVYASLYRSQVDSAPVPAAGRAAPRVAFLPAHPKNALVEP